MQKDDHHFFLRMKNQHFGCTTVFLRENTAQNLTLGCLHKCLTTQVHLWTRDAPTTGAQCTSFGPYLPLALGTHMGGAFGNKA